ncbi:DUF4760 domain-containing protein [Acinetobacter sp. YH12124]|uniref:DUF4760 domain-containing protein n=1 Tax=Acinetobacter sp. YH12124 TaxID=2601109 RepID=UPI0015D2A68E|nr:DUF4760 domain-containing protein [Acinetobacter sp. YH12124]
MYMRRKDGIGKKPILKSSTKSSLTFIFALAAFLISIITILPELTAFFRLKEWEVGDWLLFFQLLVFLVSAYIAFTTISSSKATSRERATLDTILDDNKDEELYEAKIRIHDFYKDPEGYFKSMHDSISTRKSLAQLFEVDGSKLTPAEHEVRKSLIKALNRYEFYAIGINIGLFDEELFKRMHCANVLRLWEESNTAVTQLRSFAKKDTLFKDLESLANRWKANPLKTEDIK